MSVDERLDASGIRNSHWGYLLRATVVPFGYTQTCADFRPREVCLYCPAVMKPM